MSADGMSTVTLRPVDETLLPRLFDLATTEATPDETMPPAPGSQGWTEERRAELKNHLRRKGTFAILVDGEPAGVARLTPAQAPGAAKVAIWLARSARGAGHGTQGLHQLIEEARSQGLSALIAETTTSNEPAVGALRAVGAKLWEDPDTGAIHATLRVADSLPHDAGR
jgi:RimJ/RimL family protein N-acetyltransferase